MNSVVGRTAARKTSDLRTSARNTSARHAERHNGERIGWLRAAVLGANDGIVSTASLVLGVAAAGAEHRVLLMTSVSGLIAGAMSMAAGEFVSVHSQADSEAADLAREQTELQRDPAGERQELARIYMGRGVDPRLADQVAGQLMAHDALAAHARDEWGFSPGMAAKPLQAAWTSAASFGVGAGLPIVVVALAPQAQVSAWIAGTAAVFLAALGAASAVTGGARPGPSIWRVTFWGAMAMAVTAGAGALFGAAG
jgi:VIT1/CCC1 family predicted Fe2+/Mn2+ transporter